MTTHRRKASRFTAKSAAIPKNWRTFPRRPWAISHHRYTKLRARECMHWDLYLARHEFNADSFLLQTTGSKGGVKLHVQQLWEIDARTGHIKPTGRFTPINQYSTVTVADGPDVQRVARAIWRWLSDERTNKRVLPLLEGTTYRSVWMHYCDFIKRRPCDLEKPNPWALPDIL